MLDLCCGLGGWTDGFLAAGYYCIGVDSEPQPAYKGDELSIADIRELVGERFQDISAILASPPCDEFSRFRQPWLRRKGHLPAPDMSIVEACYRLRDEIQPAFFLMENVRSAQYFLGQATIAREPYYFWGDALLIPRVMHRQKQSYRSNQKAERAKIPFDLAYSIALSIRG